MELIYSNIVAEFGKKSLEQVREYINVAEYGLALDDMAAIMLEGNAPVASDLQSLFGEAADLMAIKPGDGWSAVDELERDRLRLLGPQT